MTRALVLRPSGREGYVAIDAGHIDDLSEIKKLVAWLREDGTVERARAGIVPWAGPYDGLLAITAVVGASAAAGSFVLAVLDRFVKAHPETPIVININVSTTVVVDGREHAAHEYELVDAFFAERQALLDNAPGGAGPFHDY